MTISSGRLWTCLLAGLLGFAGHAGGQGDRLTSKPAASQLPLPKVAVGQDFVTASGQRRQVRLSEEVTLLLNQSTSGKHTAVNEIFLTAGEIYVDAKTFTVKTGQRLIRITNGKVAVRVDKQGTSVVVTRGEALVAGVPKAIKAGWQLPGGAAQAIPLPRASHVLDWTKELLSAGIAPLVPGSQ